MIGQTINNYLLERKLGEGGMSEVYFARHNRIDRVVAIKILHKNLFDNESVRNRFKNEANALIKLEHPNIVKIFDYIEQDNMACLIVEYIDGITLDDFINKFSGPIPETKATGIICTVLDAVQYAHNNRILHRDIKPGNIMVSKDGGTVKVMDFGIAKFTDLSISNVTHVNTQLGTPFYMSPEQVKGLPYSTYSDIYSIGVTLYEMATGKCPYVGIKTLFELHSKIVNDPLPPTSLYYPNVSQKLQQAIKLATNKIPEQRFRTCNDFKDFLQTDIGVVNPKRTVVVQETQEQAGSKRKKNIFIFSSIVLLGAITFFFILKNSFNNAPIKTIKNDSASINKNNVTVQIAPKPDSVALYKRVDSILTIKEISKNFILTDSLRRNELKQNLMIILTRGNEQKAIDSVIKNYEPYFITRQTPTQSFPLPPNWNQIKNDLADDKLSNGLAFPENADIMNPSAGKPAENFIATLFFKPKNNDTVYQITANYKRVGNRYVYTGNKCKMNSVSVSEKVSPKGLQQPSDEEILDAVRKNYFKQGNLYCTKKYDDEMNIPELKVESRGTDVAGYISFRISFIIKGTLCSCKVQYRLNDSGTEYILNRISTL